MKVHFIAIGGSIMHSLAILLKRKGYFVTGSDDKFFNPSKDNLEKEGLLFKEGWYPKKISKDLDFIILGMHAQKDNPELIEAQRKKIIIYSFPEYISLQSINKKRIVIAGSHGKTTITSMIMHVFKEKGIKFDFVVGAKVDGFDDQVKLSENDLIIIEGDEYLSSKIDNKPKFLHYKPHYLVLSGISWDHINVFPTFEKYCEAFVKLLKSVKKKCKVIYNDEDKILQKLINNSSGLNFSYKMPPYMIKEGNYHIREKNEEYKLSVFGNHNLLNIEATRSVCNEFQITSDFTFKSLSNYKGAKNRLELVKSLNFNSNIYRDFAHSPSKVNASINAVKDLFPLRLLISCFELHTYSTLNINFFKQYKHVFKNADFVWLFYSADELKRKNINNISNEILLKIIDHKRVKVFDCSDKLANQIKKNKWSNTNLLLMSSGNFQGLNFHKIIHSLK